MFHGVTVAILVDGEPRGSKTFAKLQIEIGSDEDSDIWLDDPEVEHHQASILLLPEGAFVEDRWSKGTFLNGKQVKKPRPIADGDEITLGRSKVVIERLLDESVPIEIPPRYCSIRLLDKCPHCGSGLPVNGVLKTITCSACHETVTFKDEYWSTMLEDCDNDYDQGGGDWTINMETDVHWRATRPKCAACAAELPVDSIPVGTDHDPPCKQCGARNSTYPAPEFTRTVLPSLSQIYCAERPGDAGGAPAADEPRPILLECPNCRGSLSASASSERTFTCRYCSADVYLPDDLWRRLHPAKTAALWYLRFDGKRPRDYEEEREAPERLASIRERLATQRKSRGFKPIALVPFVGVLIPLVILVASLIGGDGPGWVNEYPVATAAQLGQVPFAINMPPSFQPRQAPAAVVWSPGPNAPSYVSVSYAAAAPRTAEEALAFVRAQARPNTQLVRAQPLAGGFMVTLKDAHHQSAEAQVYRQKVAAPAPGYPPQVIAGSPVLWCVAHFERPAAEGPLGDVDELLGYLGNICGSLNPY